MNYIHERQTVIQQISTPDNNDFRKQFSSDGVMQVDPMCAHFYTHNFWQQSSILQDTPRPGKILFSLPLFYDEETPKQTKKQILNFLECFLVLVNLLLIPSLKKKMEAYD